MPISVEELRRAERAFRRAETAREDARAIRNDLVAKALAEGWTHQAISDVTGLSRGRISQIAQLAKSAA
jgi:uncharacterized protein YerC